MPVPSLCGPPVACARKATLAVPKMYLAVVGRGRRRPGRRASATSGSRTYNLVAGVTGQAKLIGIHSGSGGPPVGRRSTRPASGGPSRCSVTRRSGTGTSCGPTDAGPCTPTCPVVADVINTPDLSSFSAYGVENCYTFHGYALADVAQVTLAGGITGQAMSYTSQQFGSWSIVYWIVPVKMDTGATNYERVVLYVQNSGQGAVVKGLTTADDMHNLGGSLNPTNQADRALINNRTFLVAFADQLIYAQARASLPVECNAGSNWDRDLSGPILGVRATSGGTRGEVETGTPSPKSGAARCLPQPGELKIKERRSWKTWQLLTSLLVRSRLRNVDQRGHRRSAAERKQFWKREAASPLRGLRNSGGGGAATTTRLRTVEVGDHDHRRSAGDHHDDSRRVYHDLCAGGIVTAAARACPRVLLTSPQQQGNWTSHSFTTTAAPWNIGWAFSAPPLRPQVPRSRCSSRRPGRRSTGRPRSARPGASGQSVTPQSSLGAQALVVQAPASCTWVIKVTGS